MFFYTVLFVILASVMAILGFTQVGGEAAFMAKVLFMACAMLAALSIVFGRRIDSD